MSCIIQKCLNVICLPILKSTVEISELKCWLKMFVFALYKQFQLVNLACYNNEFIAACNVIWYSEWNAYNIYGDVVAVIVW